MSAPLLEVSNLNVKFASRGGKSDAGVQAVRNVSYHVDTGETLCIIGESGSGKSVSMRSLMRLLPSTAEISGSIRFEGRDVTAMGQAELEALRGGDIAMVFQEPMIALDPIYGIGEQIVETIVKHKRCSKAEARRKALEMLELVKIPSAQSRLRARSFELSGGLRQRAMIAMSLACHPKLLLADEPTTALDATVQIQILLLLKQLQREMGMAMIFVTHDLGVAAHVADRIAVMYAGEIVEQGSTGQVLGSPRHPYTRAMLASSVEGKSRDEDLVAIPGEPPDLRRPPQGCRFAPRCAFASEICRAEPPVARVGEEHTARCARLAETGLL
jgi:peptide/nickel transport system ATP-binding protein